MYTSAVVPRLVHLCTDSLSMHIGTVLLAQYYLSSVVWCAGALHTTLLLLARSHSRESCLTLLGPRYAHNFFKIVGASP
jgi:hypothetical protein